MKYKILPILLLLIGFIIGIVNNVSAEGACSFAYQEKCYDTFDDFFTKDPITAATAYPADYMTYLQANPTAVTQNPEAYEAVIVQDAAYINQDKPAFSYYLTTKDVELEITGDISSYDVVSGVITTSHTTKIEIIHGETREERIEQHTVTSISLDAIKLLEVQGNTGFSILSTGHFIYMYPVEQIFNDKKITGYDSIALEGEISVETIDIGFNKVIIKDGKVLFSYNPPKIIEIRNDNKAVIDRDKIHVYVGSNTPIALPNGILMKGNANGINRDSIFILDENSVYLSKTGTQFSTGESGIIRFSDKLETGYSSVYCIRETDTTLIVEPPHFVKGEITITTKDGTYKDIIIKPIEGNDEARLTLSIQTSEGNTAELYFSTQPPVARGNINGLQTNIAYTYSIDGKKYPWLLHNGKTLSGQDGTNQEIMSVLISKTGIDNEEAGLVVASAELGYSQMDTLLGSTKDVERQYALFQGYRTSLGHEKILGLDELFSLENIDSLELWGKIIDNTEEYKEIYLTFKATEKKPEIQEAILADIDTITFPNAIEFAATPEIKRQIIDKTDFTSGVYSKENGGKGKSFRTTLIGVSDDPETLKYALAHMPEREDMDFYPEQLSAIYFDEGFQKQTDGLDFANRYSIATTTERYLRQYGQGVTPETVAGATETIMSQRKEFADYIILDENTYYIPITHEQAIFQNDDMVRFARESGVQNIADPILKGSSDIEETKAVKEKFLTYVTESDEKGKTTIHFNNHGGPEHQWLSSGQAGSEQSDNMHRPEAISYVEFGDALLQRGQLNDVTIMIDSCYSNDFKNNLYVYLSQNGAEEYPVIITETNRGQVGWGNVFSTALKYAHEVGTPLTGTDIFEVESRTFVDQDLSVSISQKTDKTSKTEEKIIIELGSTYDDGNAEQPTRESSASIPSATPVSLPTSVIEIAANEEEVLENIDVA